MAQVMDEVPRRLVQALEGLRMRCGEPENAAGGGNQENHAGTYRNEHDKLAMAIRATRQEESAANHEDHAGEKKVRPVAAINTISHVASLAKNTTY